MVVSIEQHVDLTFDAIAWAEERGVLLEPSEEVQDAWAAHNEQLANRTLLMQTDSWFVGANVPGKARVLLPYVGGVGNYRRVCAALVADDFAGFSPTTDPDRIRRAIATVFDDEGIPLPAQDAASLS